MKKQLFIVVRPVLADHEGVAGVYQFVPNGLGKSLSERLMPNAALDVFHSNIAVDVLDDYLFQVVDEDGRQQLPVDDMADYALRSYGDVYQSERVFEQVLPAMPTSGSDGKHDWAIDTVEQKARNADSAIKFMKELLESVETLTGIADEYGSRTFADLMYLQLAILKGGFIDHYPDESKVLDIARSLPSGEQWVTFIKVEYMTQPKDA